jgi:signal transduction histidine kinase
MAPHLQRSDLKPYLFSVVSVITAAILTVAIEPYFEGKAPLFFLTIAVILSAAFGGMGAGLLATALSVGVVLTVLRDKVFVLVAAHSSLALFAVIGIAISLVIGKLRTTNTALIRARDELRVANEKLSERTEALSNSNEELERFASGLAHDLHTPLRSIGALTEVLIASNAGRMDESSKECARLIVNGVQRMESMIEGLLKYAAAVDSRDDTVLSDCNAVVERVLQDLRYEIEASGALVKVDPLPVVRVNQSRLTQVLLNLVGNAVKYRSARKPEIHISAREQGDDWRFSVTDNGIGFDMRYADEIFGMFKRLPNAEGYEGSGVGLALCKAVIQRYHGRIWVESEPGKGPTFFFTLPKAGEHNDVLRKPVVAEQSPLRAKKAAK